MFLLQLFCSFSATFTLNFLNSVVSGRKDRIGFLGSPGLVDFGVFDKVRFLFYFIVFQ